MVQRVVAHDMPLVHHALYQIGRGVDKIAHHEKARRRVVLLQRVQNGGRVAVFVARVKGQVDRLLGGVAHIVGVPLAERIRGYVADGRLPLGLERQTPVADRRGNRGLGFSVCLRGGRIGLWQQEEQHGKRNAYAGRRADAAKRVAGNGNEHK